MTINQDWLRQLTTSALNNQVVEISYVHEDGHVERFSFEMYSFVNRLVEGRRRRYYDLFLTAHRIYDPDVLDTLQGQRDEFFTLMIWGIRRDRRGTRQGLRSLFFRRIIEIHSLYRGVFSPTRHISYDSFTNPPIEIRRRGRFGWLRSFPN